MSGTDDLDRGMETLLAATRGAWAAGAPRVGWKIGINDPAVQRRLALAAPIVGALSADRVLVSGTTRAVRPAAKIAAEAEIAVLIGRDVAPSTSIDDARAAIMAIAPAIELVDYAQPSATLAEILAHSIFHEAAIFGAEHDPSLLATLGSDRPVLTRNGAPARTPDPSLAADVAVCVAHVAATLARYGERLVAGDRVICGSLVQPLPVRDGDLIAADFGSAIGSVAVTVVIPAAKA